MECPSLMILIMGPWWLVLLPFNLVAVQAFSSENGTITVRTSKGRLAGSIETSRSGRNYAAFRSIPYAKSPTGPRRFSRPESVDSWSGILDASQDAPYCIQYDVFASQPEGKPSIFGQEDCLYLSVFTHNISTKAKLPVVVFIHGGGFQSWTGARMFGPEYFMDHDIVFLSFNYRLGPMGFLSLENNEMPGNYGLHDQVMVLRWVKRNIAKFGGDPRTVTILGESAGAACAHMHTKSNLSKDLFKRAILCSGSAYSPWARVVPGVARDRTMKSGKLLGCPSDQPLIQCFRQANASDLISLSSHFTLWDTDPIVIFRPVYEDPNIPGAFFTWHDIRKHTDKSLLAGFDSVEGAIKVSALDKRKTNYIGQLDEDFLKWAPLTFDDRSPNEAPKLFKRVREFYFADRPVKSGVNLTNLYTDAWFMAGLQKLFREHVGELYTYYLEKKPSLSFIDLTGGSYPSKVKGASHGDELLYLFNLSRILIPPVSQHDDLNVSEKLVTYLANFIIHGKPTLDDTWLPSTVRSSENNLQNQGMTHMAIKDDGQFIMETDDRIRQRKMFWEQLEYDMNELTSS